VRSERGINNKIIIKVKVKLFLCLTENHATKAYWGSGREVNLHSFFDLDTG
jgi:hypothetical protein